MKYFILFFILVSCSKQELIITRGLPGSGKSTYASEYVATHKNFVHIEKDIIRREIFKDDWQNHVLNRDSEIIILHVQFERIIKYLREGKNIIVANTHLDDRYLPVFYELSHSLNLKLTIKDLRDVPLQVCIDRDAKRNIKSMLSISSLYDKYIQVTMSKG